MLDRVREVIPKRRKAYRGIRVNDVDVVELAQGRRDEAVIGGVDVGKFEFRAMLRWASGEFERPWRVANPAEIPAIRMRSVIFSVEPVGILIPSYRAIPLSAFTSLVRASMSDLRQVICRRIKISSSDAL